MPLARTRSGLVISGQIRPNLPSEFAVPNGLVGYWGFDPDCLDFSQGIALDLSGNGNIGTLNNLTATTKSLGQVGGALTFNGSSSYVDIGGFTPANQISLCGWAKLSAIVGTQNFIIGQPSSSGVGNPYNSFGLSLSYNSLPGESSGNLYPEFAISVGATRTIIGSPSPLVASTWYHIVGTYNGSRQIIYVNGVAINSTGNSGNILAGGQHTLIGNQGSPYSSYFNGLLDDVRIYNRGLDPWEIIQLYQAGLAGRRDAGDNLPMQLTPMVI